MAIYLLTITYLFMGVGYCFAQNCKGINLVPNPSFEDSIYCDSTSSQYFKAEHWFQAYSSPDYFAPTCSWTAPPPYILPNEFQHARTGSCFVGGKVYTTSGGEYPSARLIEPLVAGNKYCGTFYVNKMHSQGSTDAIQMALSVDSFTVFDGHPTEFFLPFNAQIRSDSGIQLTDTLNWMEISGSFIAEGGEQFVTLGNFLHEDSINGAFNAYYYFDDVSLCHCPDSIIPTENTFSIYPNPNTGRFTIDYSIKSVSGGHVVISDMVGRKVDNIMLSPGINQANVYLPRIRAGLYHLTFIVDGEAIRTERIVLTREEY